MKKESKQNYTAPAAEATRSKITLNVLQSLSATGTLGEYHENGLPDDGAGGMLSSIPE